LSTLVGIVQSLYRWLLPPRLPDDVREQARSRLLVGSLLAHVLVTTIGVSLYYAAFDAPSPASQRIRWAAVTAVVLAYAFVLAVFRLTGRRLFAANLIGELIFLILVPMTIVTGGVSGPIALLLLFVPIATTLLANRRSGQVWGGVTLAALLAIGVAESHGISVPSIVPPENLARTDKLVLALVFALVIGALQIYDYQADRLAEELAVERNRYAYLAGHDTLTGLPNRVTFEDQLCRALARTRRLGVPFALLYLDLDDFKPVNDRHGHQVGDAVLARIGERLRAITRENDVAARIGGDEFAMLLEGLHDPALVDGVAGKLLETIARPIEVDEASVRVTASVGAVLHPGSPADARTLTRLADKAMYRAKDGGGVHVVPSAAESGDGRPPAPDPPA